METIMLLITVHEKSILLITLLEKYETHRKLLKIRFVLYTSLLIVSTRISGGDQ
jgi:hypothetical protein